MADKFDRLKKALSSRYIIERALGRGGMATVYLAEDVKHHRKVAVKVLRPELAASLGTERFVREIRIAANLTHPHILALHDSGEADGFLFYVMPFIDGESLRERLDRERKLPVLEAIRLIEQVTSALSHAHERGVVHRDIKPENILLNGDQAVIADFGIARAVEAAGAERLTGTGLAIGTPAYMSPEQALGQEAVDERSDIYALGCVAYEMVGGHPPFEGNTAQALLAKHAVEPVPGLRATDSAVPAFLERAVQKALAKNPTDRFQTARAFGEALTTATVVPAANMPGRLRTGTVAAGLAAVLLVAASWWFTRSDDRGVERLAVLPPVSLRNGSDEEYLVDGMHNALITELSQAGVTVVGGVQSMVRYRNTEQTVREIAEELGVDAVIEPSVFWEGDSVGIDVRLIDGRTEVTLWSQSYDTNSRNVLALYREVTRAIADEIHWALTPDARARLASARVVDPEAHDALLRGQFHAARLTRADLETAIQYFQLALAKDPEYAPAYAGIAWAWTARSQMGFASREEAAPRAKAAALEAIAIDSTLSDAHHAVATGIGWIEWDWTLEERSLQRALTLNPSNADARADYSHLLLVLGRVDEAMAQIDSAVMLDPYNVKTQAFRGMVLLLGRRRYEEAIEQFKDILRTVPNHSIARNGLFQALHALGRDDESVEHLEARYRAVGDEELAQALAQGRLEGGFRGGLLATIAMSEARSTTTSVPPLQLAELYALVGLNDDAIAWLEKGYDVHAANLPYIGMAPVNDSLRGDPRFQALLHRMNLPNPPPFASDTARS